MVTGSELIVNPEYGSRECEELCTHHEHTACNIVVGTNDQGRERKPDGRKKGANSHKFFCFSITNHAHLRFPIVATHRGECAIPYHPPYICNKSACVR